MGIDRKDVIFYGVDVGYENVDFDEYEPEICGAIGRKFDIIDDGMGGKYAYAGKILITADEYEGFPLTDLSSIYISRDEVESAVKERFPHVGDFRIFVLTQWS